MTISMELLYQTNKKKIKQRLASRNDAFYIFHNRNFWKKQKKNLDVVQSTKGV